MPGESRCAVQFFKIRVKHYRGRELQQEEQEARSRTIMFQHRKSRDLHRNLQGEVLGGEYVSRYAAHQTFIGHVVYDREDFISDFSHFSFWSQNFFSPCELTVIGRPMIPFAVFRLLILFDAYTILLLPCNLVKENFHIFHRQYNTRYLSRETIFHIKSV